MVHRSAKPASPVRYASGCCACHARIADGDGNSKKVTSVCPQEQRRSDTATAVLPPAITCAEMIVGDDTDEICSAKEVTIRPVIAILLCNNSATQWGLQRICHAHLGNKPRYSSAARSQGEGPAHK